MIYTVQEFSLYYFKYLYTKIILCSTTYILQSQERIIHTKFAKVSLSLTIKK